MTPRICNLFLKGEEVLVFIDVIWSSCKIQTGREKLISREVEECEENPSREKEEVLANGPHTISGMLGGQYKPVSTRSHRSKIVYHRTIRKM